MSSLPPDKTAEFTASDILSADAWTGRAPKPVLGMDVVCTKIAVDFQNMRRETVDECIRRNMELLREQTAEAQRFAEVQVGSAVLVALRVQGRPGGFLGLCHTLPRGAWDVNL